METEGELFLTKGFIKRLFGNIIKIKKEFLCLWRMENIA